MLTAFLVYVSPSFSKGPYWCTGGVIYMHSQCHMSVNLALQLKNLWHVKSVSYKALLLLHWTEAVFPWSSMAAGLEPDCVGERRFGFGVDHLISHIVSMLVNSMAGFCSMWGNTKPQEPIGSLSPCIMKGDSIFTEWRDFQNHSGINCNISNINQVKLE